MIYDSIIIGKGPAGITASIYIKRAGLKALVIGKDGGSLEKAERVENYYGFEEPISGKELILSGIKQAENLGIEVITDEVVDIQFQGQFFVKTRNREYQAKTVILATGAGKKTPNIKGIKELEGKGVSYCAVCDAFFYRNKNVAVIGEGDYALAEVNHLLPVVKSVSLLTNGKKPVENRSTMPDIAMNQTTIHEIRGKERVEEIVFSDQSQQKVDGVFIAMGVATSSDLARKLGAITEKGKVVVDENGMTNLPGLFAAGDCTGGILQISKAVYEGTKTGLAVIQFLR